jgi:hypothetical protein
MGLPGAPGAPGQAGPAGPATTASFALSGPQTPPTVNIGEFAKIVEKSLTPGFWLVFSTVSAIGGHANGNDERASVMDCQLGTATGGIVGASRSTGAITLFTNDSWTIPVNAAFPVSPTDVSPSVSVWCASPTDIFSIDNAQLIVVNIQNIN